MRRANRPGSGWTKTKRKIYHAVPRSFGGVLAMSRFGNFPCFWITRSIYSARLGRRYVLPRRAYRRDTGDDYRRQRTKRSFFRCLIYCAVNRAGLAAMSGQLYQR